MADPIMEVQPPRRMARKGGISTVAEFREQKRLAAAAARLVYVADPCETPNETVAACWTVEPEEPEEKTFDGIDQGQSVVDRFFAYAGVTCTLGGDASTDYAARARAILEQGEDRYVEERYVGWLADATPSYHADAVAAVAAADQALDADYIGLGLLVMSRSLAVRALASGAIRRPDASTGVLWTANGTPVLATSAIDTDVIYASGAVTVLHSSTSEAGVEALTTNHYLALAERAYSILVDCEYAEAYVIGEDPDL